MSCKGSHSTTRRNLLIEAQHEYINYNLNLFNFVCTEEYHSSFVDVKQDFHTVFLDMSNIFDVVNQRLTLNAHNTTSIYGWVASFLGNRSMRVRMEEALSPELPVCSWIPQGSVLVLLLFLTT